MASVVTTFNNSSSSNRFVLYTGACARSRRRLLGALPTNGVGSSRLFFTAARHASMSRVDSSERVQTFSSFMSGHKGYQPALLEHPIRDNFSRAKNVCLCRRRFVNFRKFEDWAQFSANERAVDNRISSASQRPSAF